METTTEDKKFKKAVYKKAWKLKNLENIKEKDRIYRAEKKHNKEYCEKRKQYQKIWTDKNKNKIKKSREKSLEKTKIQQRLYKETHKEILKEKAKNRWPEYYKNNKDVLKEKAKKYYQDNKENLKLYRKIYRDKNKDRTKKYNKKRYYKNIEKSRESAKIRARNRDSTSRKLYSNNRYKYILSKNPMYKIISSCRSRIRQAFKNKKFLKCGKTFDLINCTPEFLKEHLSKQFKIGMTLENYGKFGWHIDHIIPLASAKTIEDVKELCHFTNLQPLWAEENLKKGCKL
jgi:hypothetical protein